MDQQPEGLFASRVSIKDMIASAYVALPFGIGYRLGLFEQLTTASPTPQTAAEIAAATNLKERYIFEWAKMMASVGILECSEDGTTFWLTEQQKEAIAKHKTEANMLQMLRQFYGAHDDIVECFQPTGPRGLPYSKYATFHADMACISSAIHDATLLQQFVPSIPENMEAQLKAGIRSLDVGCGRGYACMLLAKAFPNSSFVGVDISTEAIDYATNKASEAVLSNCSFVCADLVKLPNEWTETFDYVTAFDVIHDLPQPRTALKEIRRVMKSTGAFSLVDCNVATNAAENKGNPVMPLVGTASLFHCMPISLYFEGGEGLGAMWGREKAKELLAEAGLTPTSLEGLKFSWNFHGFCKKA